MNNVRFLYLASVVIIVYACVGPKQPASNKKEMDFFNSLMEKYNCTVSRNISAILLTEPDNRDLKGSYSLNILLSCDSLLKFDKDSVRFKTESFLIAKHIYGDIIEDKSRYKKVWVSYSCDTANSNYKDLVYVYSIDTLRK